MSFRAKSKARQWTLWLCAALMALAVYVVLSRLLHGSMSWNIVLPRNQRIVLPILAFFWLFVRETRWDGVERKVKGKGEKEECEDGKTAAVCLEKVEKAGGGGQGKDASGPAVQPVDAASCRVREDGSPSFQTRQDAASTEKTNRHSAPAPDTCTSAPSPSDDATGEELFDKARALCHQTIPDFNEDADYLNLLEASAAKGHAPALAKLGEYAVRRCAWVEAYYWMKQAQRNGMHGLSPTLRVIRNEWAKDGFPRQSSNVSEIFTKDAGCLGRALLRLDSGHEAAKAREYLKAHHPEFCE